MLNIKIRLWSFVVFRLDLFFCWTVFLWFCTLNLADPSFFRVRLVVCWPAQWGRYSWANLFHQSLRTGRQGVCTFNAVKKNALKTRRKTACPQMLMTTEPKRWPSHSAKNTNERYETTVFQLDFCCTDFPALFRVQCGTLEGPVHGQWPGQRPATKGMVMVPSITIGQEWTLKKGICFLLSLPCLLVFHFDIIGSSNFQEPCSDVQCSDHGSMGRVAIFKQGDTRLGHVNFLGIIAAAWGCCSLFHDSTSTRSVLLWWGDEMIMVLCANTRLTSTNDSLPEWFGKWYPLSPLASFVGHLLVANDRNHVRFGHQTTITKIMAAQLKFPKVPRGWHWQCKKKNVWIILLCPCVHVFGRRAARWMK